MKRLVLRLTFAALALAAAGQAARCAAETRVKGVLQGENRWKANNGPYYIDGDVLVPRFARLTIGPGTRIVVAAGKGADSGIPQFDALDSNSISIKIEGVLACAGKNGKRIVFVPAAESGEKLGWYGIVFMRAVSGLSEIAFADITGAYNGITVFECAPLVRTTVMERNNIGLNCLRNGSSLAFNCIFVNNFAAGIRIQEASPHIANSIIVFNQNNGLWCDGISRIKFEYNCVYQNGDGNILDCDPRLGNVDRVNKRKDSVDYANNFYRDPVFSGSVADSAAFARDISVPTDTSKIKNKHFARIVSGPLADSGYANYRRNKHPRFTLSRYSPCIQAGNPSKRFQNTDGSRNSMGIYGGPEFLERGKE